MKWNALVALLANRINQSHVIDTYMRKVYRAGVMAERNRNASKDMPDDIDYSPWYCGRTVCCRNHEGYLPPKTCDKALCPNRITYPKTDMELNKTKQ